LYLISVIPKGTLNWTLIKYKKIKVTEQNKMCYHSNIIIATTLK